MQIVSSVRTSTIHNLSVYHIYIIYNLSIDYEPQYNKLKTSRHQLIINLSTSSRLILVSLDFPATDNDNANASSIIN